MSNPKRTEAHNILNSYYTEKLLELKDAILLNVENTANSKIIEFKMMQRIHKCPICGNETSKVHDYRIQEVKDISILGENTILRIHKRRHVCKTCGKKFYEHVPLIPKYQRTTNRLWMYVINSLIETRSMKSIAESCNLSPVSVSRIVDHLNYNIDALPDVISIDEFKDHVHMLVKIPPKYCISDLVGYLKGKSSLIIFDRHVNLKYKYGNRYFWCCGYSVRRETLAGRGFL